MTDSGFRNCQILLSAYFFKWLAMFEKEIYGKLYVDNFGLSQIS